MRQGSLQDANFLHPVLFSPFLPNLAYQQAQILPKWAVWSLTSICCSMPVCPQSAAAIQIPLFPMSSLQLIQFQARYARYYNLVSLHFLCFSANDTLAWLAATSPFQYSELWKRCQCQQTSPCARGDTWGCAPGILAKEWSEAARIQWS